MGVELLWEIVYGLVINGGGGEGMGIEILGEGGLQEMGCVLIRCTGVYCIAGQWSLS